MSCCVAESVGSQGVNSMVGACVDSTKSLTPALKGAGIKVVDNRDNPDMTINPDDIGAPESGETCNESVVSRFWEAEACMSVSQDHVQGRLKQNLAFWKDVLQAPPPILECIEKGYRLPLKFLVPSHSQTNHKSAELHHEFVDKAIQNLVLNCCVTKEDQKPYLCSPLSVVENSSGKLRLVLNLQYLNQFLYAPHFKYEDLHVVVVVERNELLFKLDLKSGYHHVDIYPEHQKYLGFQWDIGSVTGYYVFAVLPFGLSTACYIFTKLMRPLVRYWQGRGLKATVYLDNGIIAVKGESEALKESSQVQNDLQCAGFVINIEKSVWDPRKNIE